MAAGGAQPHAASAGVAGPGRAAPVTRLLSGYDIPLLGLGTWPMTHDESAAAVAQAIGLGYRLIDTAASYGNEAGVGRGLRESGVARSELFVTTKLRGSEQGYKAAKRALRASLDRLGLDYVDLYLIHWPLPRLDLYVESFQAMLELIGEGLVRSAGVSNFKASHIERLRAETGALPAVNQIQLSPALARTRLHEYLAVHGICTEAWSPLGQAEHVPANPLIIDLARRYGKSPAQIILRWHVQQGIVAIPKSADPARQAANLDVFGFELTASDMRRLTGLDQGEDAARDSDVYEEF